MDFIKNIVGEGNEVIYEESEIKRLNLRINGANNKITLDKSAIILNLSVFINGDNNTIFIGESCSIVGDILIKGNNNALSIAKNTSFQNTNINIQEGTRVSIGENCMFASRVQIRTTDSHSITDMDGNRINHAKDIVIGDKCWLGLEVLVMKGSIIPDETIVGARATVTGSFTESNTIIAGTPAKKIKSGVKWSRKLL